MAPVALRLKWQQAVQQPRQQQVEGRQAAQTMLRLWWWQLARHHMLLQ
jgi:hypothetical protein